MKLDLKGQQKKGTNRSLPGPVMTRRREPRSKEVECIRNQVAPKTASKLPLTKPATDQRQQETLTATFPDGLHHPRGHYTLIL